MACGQPGRRAPIRVIATGDIEMVLRFTGLVRAAALASCRRRICGRCVS